MEYDKDKVDEMVLALLYLTMFEEGSGLRAWKGHNWDVLDRLHHKEYISDPRSKAKSVVVTEKGRVPRPLILNLRVPHLSRGVMRGAFEF